MAEKKQTSQSTQSQSLAEGMDKELTCAICLSRFNQPKLLPCLHSYCKGCLEDMLKKSCENKSITCPQCKVVHELPPQGVDGFSALYMINNFLELLHIHENAATDAPIDSIKCTSGLDKNAAIARCLTCSAYLCENCCTIHQKLHLTKDHDVKTFEEIKHSDKKTGIRSLHKRQYCMEHKDKQLELYCKTCKKVICLVCAVVNHNKHECAVINEVRDEIQKVLEKKISEVQTKEVEFQNHQKATEDLLKISNDDAESSRKEINKACDGLIQEIESRRAQLLAQFDNFHEAEMKQITAESESVALSLLRLSDSIRFMRQLLDNGDDIEVINVSDQTSQTLSTLASMTYDVNTLKRSLLRPKFESIEESIGKFCEIVSTVEPNDIVVSNVPEKIKRGEESSFDVCLSKEVSERGYEGALEVTITGANTIVHESLAGPTLMPTTIVKKKGFNRWTISFELYEQGKHQAKLCVGGTYKTITLLCEREVLSHSHSFKKSRRSSKNLVSE